MQNKFTFKTIQKILRHRSYKLSLNKTLLNIHNELGIGDITGSYIELSRQDHEKLKRWSLDEFGINPENTDIPKDRLSVAALTQNEKWATDKVFQNMLQVNCRESGVRLKQGNAFTPAGTLLKVNSNDIDINLIENVILVENGIAALNWHLCNIPDDLKEGLMVYRGHDQDAKIVREWLAQLPDSIRKIGYFDFDPSGIGMSIDYNMDSILIPANLNDELISGVSNKKRSHEKQIHQRPNLVNEIPSGLTDVWKWMTYGQRKCAITQERLITMNCLLECVDF